MEGGYQTMNRQIDERVVSMQFDNQRFEKNISQSISTLDKLKQKLNLTGASKGLENINAAAKKVDMNGLANGVEAVRSKFSAMEVIGVTALANITNSAVNAGKRMVEALTIAPIKTGFNEYELKMGSIQTIMAGPGETLETVNKYLNELNEYSDQTIYSFQDMTSNIGKFTNAGVKLEDAVLAIKGISNEAAVSGANANEASRAMYNFAQALSAGYVKLIDWKSIELANMATIDFKNQLISTAVSAGTLKDNLDGTYTTLEGKVVSATQNFNDSLQDQWMTSEVLINTLKNYADETTDIGKKATQAATEVKTFSQMLDTLKESAQSGWAQTWELIFGDFYEGKTLWTSINDVVGGILDKISHIRNSIVKSTFAKSFSELYKKVNSVLEPIKNTADSIATVTDAVKDYGIVVDEIIGGKWGNGQARWDKLTESGYNWAHAQNLVNEKLGNSVRHATDYKEAQDAVTASSTKLTDTEKDRLKQLVKMTDAELEALNYSKKQIKAFRDLKKAAEKIGVPIDEFIDKIDKIDGKWLFLETFANVGRSLSGIFTALKIAWQEIFNPEKESIIEKISERLFDIISAVHKFSRMLLLTNTETGELNENGDKLMRTFKGVFAIFDIVTTILGGPLKFAFKLITDLLGAFNINILDVTAYIGDAIVKFRVWLDSTLDFTDVFKKITPYIKEAIDAVRNWFDAVQPLKKVVDIFRSIIDAIKDLSIALYNTDIVQNLIHGLTNGIKAGAKMVWDGIKNLAKGIINTIKKVLGIHSPSTVMIAIGGFIVSGLVIGLKNGAVELFDSIKGLGSKIINAFKDLDLSSISTLFYNLFRLFPSIKILNPLSALLNVFNVLGKDTIRGLSNGISQAAPAVWDAIVSVAKNLIESFKKILGIHSPSRVMMIIGGFIVSGLLLGLKDGAGSISEFFIDLGNNTISLMKTIAGKIASFIKNLDFGTVFAIAATTGLVILAKKTIDALTMFGEAAKGFSKIGTGVGDILSAIAQRIKPQKSSFPAIAKGVLKIAVAIGILAGSVYLLAQLDTKKMWWSVLAIGALATIIGGLVAALSLLKTGDGIKVGAYTFIIMTISASIALLAKALKTLGTMDESSLDRGYKAIAGLGAMVVALIFATKLAGKNAGQVGKTLLWISVSLLLLIFVTKQVAKLNDRELTKGVAFMIVFMLFIKYLMKATLGAGYNTKGLGLSILSISIAILMLAAVARIIGGMDTKALVKGTVAMAIFAAIIAGLIHFVKIGNDTQIAKVGGVILAVGVAILLMTVATALLGRMDTGLLVKGQIAVGVFAAMIAGLIYVIKKHGGDAKNIGKAMLSISIAIGILALTAVVLGLIDVAHLAKGVIVVGLLSLMMMGLINATKGAQNCMKNLIVITTAIVLLSTAVAILSLIEPERLVASGGALAAIMTAFALMIKASSSIGDATSMIKPLATMIIVVGVLGTVLWGLSQLPMGNDILQKATALAIIMNAMSASLFVVSKLGGNIKGALKGVLALTAMVVPLMAFTAALAFIPALPNHVLNTLSAVLPVMVVMTALLIPLTLIGTLGGWTALIGVLALTAMVVPLAAFTAALAFIPRLPSHASSTLQTLLPVMVLMTALLIPLTLIGLGMWSALIGALALTAMVVPLMAFVAALKFMPKFPEHVPEQLKLILHAMTVMTALLVPLTLIGLLGPAALLGIAALYPLMEVLVVFGALATVIGAFMSHSKKLEDFLSKGISIMEQLAYGLGSVLSHFVTGFTNELLTILPAIGQALSDFMTKSQGFIDGCRAVGADNTVLKGAVTMVGAILAFAAANVVSHLSQLLSFGQSFSMLGFELSLFMIGANGFIEGAKKITPEVAKGIKALSEAIITLTAANMIDGITKFFSLGTSSLSSFGTQLSTLGTGLNNFITNLGPVTDDQVSITERAAKIIKTLAQASSELPNSGGLLGDLVGNNDMGPWAAQMPILAQGIVGFTNTLINANIDSSAVDIAKKAAEIVKVLAKAAVEIPNAGGYLATWIGDNDLSKWANQLPNVASGIVGFINGLTTTGDGGTCAFGEEQVNIAKQAAEVVKTLAKAAAEVPNAGGYLATWIGDNDLSTWANQLPNVGKGVAGFASELGTFSETQLATITAATKAIKIIANMSQNYDSLGDLGDFTNFGNGMITLAKKIKDFATKMAEISLETINASVDKIKAVIDVAKSVAKTDTSACKEFASNMASMAKGAIDGFINAFSSKDTTGKVSNAATTMIKEFIGAMEGMQKKVNSAVSSLANEAADKIVKYGKTDNKDAFKSAGKDLINGLINGLKNETKKQQVYDAAFALGQLAVQGEKDGQESNSPSKATTRAGKWLGEGLIIGMKNMMRAVYKSGNSLGETASTTISSAVARIANVINSDMDTQPTIRPVLDLSDVKAGANTINSMFGANRTLAVSAPGIGAISASMSNRQNGNNDLVSAINKLAKSNKSGDTYNINGVSYSEGSDVADAIQTLVRAATIEGRT